MLTVYIYGLYCPIAKTIRYVGKSIKPKSRFKAHIKGALMETQDCHHKARWIRKLLSVGMEPTLVILQEVGPDERWQDVEREFIASAESRGWDLTNSTAGGEGLDYIRPEDKARYLENLSRAMANFSATEEGKAQVRKMVDAALEPEALARRNAAIRASAQRPEFIAKMSGVSREINSRPEVKASRSKSSKAMWADPAKREKITTALRAPEVKAKQSDRRREAWADPVVGERLRAISASPETRKKKSEAAKRRSTPEYRAMMAEKTRASWRANGSRR